MEYDIYNYTKQGREKWPLVVMFLLGLGSQTKFVFLGGCLAISELVVFIIAPFLLMSNWRRMRLEGISSFVIWIVAISASLILSSYINHTPIIYIYKASAVIYAVICYYIVFCTMLRKRFQGLGWFFVGFAFSSVLITFAFNPGVVVSEAGVAHLAKLEVEEIVSGPLYWIQRLKNFGQLPILCAYLKVPLFYSIITPVLFAVFAMYNTVSGRSVTISVLLCGTIILFGRKNRAKMRTIGKNVFILIFTSFLVVLLYARIYKYCASSGILGIEVQRKYEVQTDGGRGGIGHLIMRGRSEFFIGLFAAIDRPIIGYGPMPEDVKGYMDQFILKYGTSEDIRNFRVGVQKMYKNGFVLPIKSHSMIIGAWITYGIAGLLFYLWLLWAIYKHIRLYISAIPQWFGYFALTIPTFLWHIFFSPFGDRATFALFVACLMLAKAVANGKILLPYDMENEARRYE